MFPLAGDGAFACQLAVAAGNALLTLREDLGYDDPANLKQAGDKISHELLIHALKQWRPEDAILSEEGADDPRRLDAERVWIIDPLDGTREYSEARRTDWAVHIALWQRGEVVAGAIGLPARNTVLSTEAPPAYPPLSQGRLKLACSRTRPPAFLTELAVRLDAELVPMGSAGVKVAAVISGDVDAYVHAGGQYEWDSAAPVAVARATGLHTSRVDGSPLVYNRPDPLLPDLLVCRTHLAEQLLSALSSVNMSRSV